MAGKGKDRFSGITFMDAATIVATAGIDRPSFIGRGRVAEPFTVPGPCKVAADTAAGLPVGKVAVAASVDATDKDKVAAIRSLAAKLNKVYTEVHFGAQVTEDGRVTLFAISGPMVVKTRKPRAPKK